MTKTFDPDIGKGTRWQKGQRSPNPGGRPRSRLLSEALRAKLAEIKTDDAEGRTYAEVLASNLVTLACSEGRNAVAAASEIGDRVEGRAHMSLAVADVTAEIHGRTDQELRFFLSHGHWPERDDVPATEQNFEATGHRTSPPL